MDHFLSGTAMPELEASLEDTIAVVEQDLSCVDDSFGEVGQLRKVASDDHSRRYASGKELDTWCTGIILAQSWVHHG